MMLERAGLDGLACPAGEPARMSSSRRMAGVPACRYNEAMSATLIQESPPSGRYHELPVEVVAVPVKAIRPEAGMSVLLKGLTECSVLPVTDRKKRLLGVIRDQDVLVNPELGASLYRQGGKLLTLRRGDAIARALEVFERTEQSLIPILDEKGRYSGQCASRTLLLKLMHGLLRPARVGGLATPLGVYMTSGYYTSGAGWKGLVATGMLFAALVTALDWLGMVVYSAAVSLYPPIMTWDGNQLLLLQMGFVLVAMLSLLRLSPMSALHAAEHMTINAIENDLDITPEVVYTQERVHIRCGTNLMVLLMGVQMVGMSYFFMQDRLSWLGMGLYLGIWIFLVARYWRQGGAWLQRHFTTKHPSPAQLESGLKAGRELLTQFTERPHANPPFWRKLWGAGLFHMLVSFLATSWVLNLIIEHLGRG